MLSPYLSNSRYNQRLQISLSPELRQKADRIAKTNKITLSELFRYFISMANVSSLKVDFSPDKKKPSFNDALDLVAGTISAKDHPEWKDAKSINKWLRETRKNFDRKFDNL